MEISVSTESNFILLTKKFLESKLFIILISALTLVCWKINSLYVTSSIFGILLILQLIFKTKLYSFVAMLSLVFAGYKKYSMSFKDYGLYIMVGILLIAIVLFVVRVIQNKKDVWFNLKKCSILYTTALLTVPMLISTINSPVKGTTVALSALWALNLVIILAVAYGIPNTKESKEKICFSFVMLLYVILIQVAIVSVDYLKGHNFSDLIDTKDFQLGWNLANHAIVGLNIGVICSVYLFTQNINMVYKIFLIISSALGIICNFFVACRGGMLGIGVCLLVIALILFVYYRKKWKILLLPVIMTIALLGIIYLFISKFDNIKIMIDHFKNVGLSDSGRKPIYDMAIDLFKDNKLIGTGWGSSAYYLKDVFCVTNYHNWFLQMLATCGIVGVVCLAVYLLDIFRIKSYKDIFTWFVLVLVIYFLVHGMVDTVLFSKNFHFFFTILVTMIKLPNNSKIEVFKC